MTATTLPRGGSGEMFDRIAHRYDLLNRILSLGIDRGWRKKMIRSLQLQPGHHLLDLATGTGDVALMAARSCDGVQVTGVDPSPGMLAVGEQKVAQAGLSQRIRLVQGEGETLNLPSATFDAVTVAFGVRNMVDRPKALREMARVLKPGGRLAILELSEPRGGVMGPLARFHVHVLVPRLGALLSGAREYRYLQESIERFPPAGAFVRTIEEAGFEDVQAHPLTFGTCHLYTGRTGASR